MEFKVRYQNKEKQYNKKVSLLEIIKDEDPSRQYICATVNNRVRSLDYEVSYDADIEFLTLKDSRSIRIYEASLRYIVAMAFYRAYPETKIKFSYSVSRSLAIHIMSGKAKADMAMYIKINHEIEDIINKDYKFERRSVSTEEAATFYKKHDYLDKLEILPYRPEKRCHVYNCGGYENYMFSHLVPSTGYIKLYKLRLYTPGFILQYPRSEVGGLIPEFEDAPNFMRALNASFEWSHLIGCDTVSGINKYIENDRVIDLINMSEAKHNRMLCELGQLIEDDSDRIRLICIAGPSSSGKTTFANRLRVELLSRGLEPIRISLDDYYLPKELVPNDENGNKDFETINALDIEQFNADMVNLIAGQEVTLPKFDFKIGKKVPGRTLKISSTTPIIIEGIHALNDKMTMGIPRDQKFKIYISPQSQMNLDDHNPLFMTDLRLIRRIVRDKRDRNSSCEETMSMWASVRSGEFKWIYPNQEGADYVFNSLMPYELCVMKKYIQSDLEKIDIESPYFPVAERLLRMLKYFVNMPDEWIPSNSLMREFIGGSCYADV